MSDPEDLLRLLSASTRRRIGPYEIQGEIGRGGMGIVVKGFDPRLERVVAIKRIRAGFSEADRLRFAREARLTAALDHPGIARVYEVLEENEEPLLVMGYVPGEELGDLCQKGLRGRRSAELTTEVARALAYAHDKGVLHRDLKPSNVRVTPEGRAVLLDFGLARPIVESVALTHGSQVLGTPSYMAPEQLQDAHGVGTPADVYGIGAVLYECLTGRPPFTADTPLQTLTAVLQREPTPVRVLNPEAHADLETICLKCLEKEPQRRYASAAEVADELQRFLDGLPILASPPSAASRVWRTVARNRGLSLAILLAATSLAAGVTYGLFQRGRAQETLRAQQAQEAKLALQELARAKSRSAEAGARRRLQEAVGTLNRGSELLQVRRFAAAEQAYQASVAMIQSLDSTLLPPTEIQLARRARSSSLLGAREARSEGGLRYEFPKGRASHGFSPDGDTLARISLSSGKQCQLELWDLSQSPPSPKESFSIGLPTTGGWLQGPFTPNGEGIVAVTSEGVSLWNLRAQRRVWLNPLSTHLMRTVALSPDGSLAALAPSEAGLHLVDGASGKTLRVLIAAQYKRSAIKISFSSDSARMLVSYDDGMLLLWQVKPEIRLLRSIHAHRSRTSGCALARDPLSGKLIGLTAARDDGDFGLYRLDESSERISLLDREGGSIELFDHARHGHRVALGTSDGTVWLFHISGRLLAQRRVADRFRREDNLALSPDGRRLVTNANGTTLLWDLPGVQLVPGIGPLAFASDRELASGEPGQLVIRNLETEVSEKIPLGLNQPRDLAWSDDSQRLAISLFPTQSNGNPIRAHKEGVVAILNRKGSVLRRWPHAHAGTVAFLGSEAVVAGAVPMWFAPSYKTWDLSYRLRSYRANEPPQLLPWHVAGVAAISVCGGRFASASHDGTVAIWSQGRLSQLFDVIEEVRYPETPTERPGATPLADRERMSRFRGALYERNTHPLADLGATCVAWDRSGQKLAVGSFSGKLWIWDVDDRAQPPVRLEGHDHGIVFCAFVDAEDRLVSVSRSGQVVVWDLHMRRPLRRLEVGFRVTDCAISPSGRTIAIATAAKVTWVFDLSLR